MGVSELRSLLHGAIIAAWLVLLLHWALNSHHREADPAAARLGDRKRIVFGPAAALIVWVVSRLPVIRHMHQQVQATTIMAVAGAVLVALGFGIAIWARRASGGSRAFPGTRSEGRELLTDGPYAYVRHPLYAALLVMALGTAIALGPNWGIAGIMVATSLIWNARAEEAELARRFPQAYAAYRARTKMLIPGVF